MAAESNLEAQQERVHDHQNLSFVNDDELFDDVSNEEDDFLDEYKLQEINVDNLQMFNPVEETIKFNNNGLIDIGDSKTLLSTELKVENYSEENDINSDEVKTIIKKLRDEIEGKVREEMKDELKNYHERMKAVGITDEPEKTYFGQAVDQEDMDPRLHEAMVKMRKLDKILLKKIQIEREVKRNRILLEKRMRQEIADMTKGVNIHKDIMMNTEKFLELEPPARHNEDINLDGVDGVDLPPFFKTQISENEILWEQDIQPSCNVNIETGANRAESDCKKSSRSSESQFKFETKENKQKTDFIKRNIELAANADQAVAMTDDEKKRLAELLEGIDELSGPEESAEENSVNPVNSCQLVIHPGEGFCPDNTELKNLASINERLKALIPEDEYQSLVHTNDGSSSPVAQLFNRVGMQTQTTTADLSDRYGERVLFETKDERELKTRLQSIEQALEKFNAPNEDESPEECHLTDEQLESLLDQCARYMSVSVDSQDQSSRSVASSRLSLLENAPKLTDEQLQKLLSEAHFPMSSRLLSLDGDNIFEDKSCAEAIRAETWKVIKDVDLDEHVVSVAKTPSQINIDQDLESHINIADNASLNVSNNHNKNISTDTSKSNNHGQDIRQETEDFVARNSPTRYSAFEFVETSVYSGSVASSLHGSSSGLPRISQSNGVSRSESYLDNFIMSGMSIPLPRESTEEAVRLPNISTKSFLVHTQQGLNNIKEKDRISLPTREPFQIVCNDFSDIKENSVSGDKDGTKCQGYGYKSSAKNISSIQSKLPKNRQSKDQ